MVNETQTYDSEQIIRPFGLEDIDRGFYNWWDQVLGLHYTDKDSNKQKIPVNFVTQELWFKSRQEGLRNDDGQIIVPVIAIARTDTNDETSGPLGRQFADVQDYHIIAKELDIKNSKIKNLLDARSGSFELNTGQPIYEMFAVPTPDHFVLRYSVAIWAPYMEDMNSFIEKIGQEFNYKSKKSFVFDVKNGFYLVARKTEDLGDDSNLDDYSNVEREIRKEYTFDVSAYIIPESNERAGPMRRYFSQSRVVIKQETVLSDEELAELLKK